MKKTHKVRFPCDVKSATRTVQDDLRSSHSSQNSKEKHPPTKRKQNEENAADDFCLFHTYDNGAIIQNSLMI